MNSDVGTKSLLPPPETLYFRSPQMYHSKCNSISGSVLKSNSLPQFFI